MTRHRLVAFALSAFAACTVAVAEDAPAMKLDAAKLVGTYKIVDGMKAGEKISDDAKMSPVTFAKDKITMKAGDMAFAFSYKIDPSKTPATIDMTILEPEGLKGQKSKGIIKMADQKVTLAYDGEGKTTPKKFESTADNGYFLFELEKAKGAGKGKYKGKKKVDKDN